MGVHRLDDYVHTVVGQTGAKPPAGDGPELGDFGCLRAAADEAVADTLLGSPQVGAWAPESAVVARYRWLQGIAHGDNARLGASWSMFLHRTRLLTFEARANQRGLVRVRKQPFDWAKAPKSVPPKQHTQSEALAGADRRAKAALSADQASEVRRIVDERFAQAGLS